MVMNAADRLNGKVIIALGRAYRNAHKKSMVLFRKRGLTMAQFTVMEVLYSKGELTIQQVIDKVLSSSGNITVVVRNLEAVGLIYRRANPEDRRSYLIGLTEKGRKTAAAVLSRHMANLAEALTKLTPKDKTTVVGILKKLKD